MAADAVHTAVSPYGGLGPTIMGITWTLALLATILLALRIWSRIKLVPLGTAALSWTCLSWTASMISQAMLTASCYYGVGNHVRVVAAFETVSIAMKWSIISSAIVLFGIGTAKVAIIAFLLTVQGYTHVRLQYFLYFLAVTNLAFNTALPFVIIFQCNPPAGEWDPEVAKWAKCRPASINETFGEFTAGWNAFTDLALAIYPTILLWNIQMAKKVKIGTSCLMGVGIFATGCAAAKGWAIHFISDGVDDITYNTSPLWLLGVSELWICLILASIPPLWPMVKQYVLGGRTSGARSYGKGNTPSARAEKSIGLRTIGAASASRSKYQHDQSDSLERILDLQDQSHHGIKVSRNITVSTESRDNSESFPRENIRIPSRQTEGRKKENEVLGLDSDSWSSEERKTGRSRSRSPGKGSDNV